MSAKEALTAAIMEDLEQPLLPICSTDVKNEKNVNVLCFWKYHVMSFAGGSAIGALMSIIAFQVLAGILDGMNSTQVFFYSIGSAALTSIIAYVVFCAVTSNYNMSSTNAEFVDKFEIFYAIGVFLGFCSACEVSDLLSGTPVVSVALTVVMSFIWAGVMFFGGTRFAEVDDSEDESQSVTQEP